jgi:hypothetical protein
MRPLQVATILVRLLLQSRAALAAENLALRQQVAVLQRTAQRPRLRRRDRIFWVWLARLWRGWRSSLLVVQPETVLRWHRQGFRLYWRWKPRSRCGRSQLDREIRVLIRGMSRDNPTWGRRGIRSELHLLGYEVAELTVAKYMVRGRRPPRSRQSAILPWSCTEMSLLTATGRDVGHGRSLEPHKGGQRSPGSAQYPAVRTPQRPRSRATSSHQSPEIDRRLTCGTRKGENGREVTPERRNP